MGRSVFIRPHREVQPMSAFARAKRQMISWSKSEENNLVGDDDCMFDRRGVQFRFESQPKAPIGFCNRVLGSCWSGRIKGLTFGVRANQILARFLHWMFRVNFVFLFLIMFSLFVGLILTFSALIQIAGQFDPQCVQIGGNDFDESGTPFLDAFALSWTTFSTVGYGSTYTALSHDHSNQHKCFWVNFLCSIESLFGVIYSGFCGAILFGKVLRIQSCAQIVFSDPIVIRYGAGVSGDFDGTGESSGGGDGRNPCPVLEFRIVNALFGEVGGEIMDATLTVVANVELDEADALFELSDTSVTNGKSSFVSVSSTDSTGTDSRSDSKPGSFWLEHLNLRRALGKWDGNHRMDEDAAPKVRNEQFFSKMLVEPSEHPFFKRVWLARHVLDEFSPILKPRVRRQIQRNGGSWPAKINDYQSIRDSLHFNQILVSMNGVSNVSANDVYAQRIYDFVDINIGYQFVNLLYRDANGKLGVDTDLLNDVREQDGGGGEPLIMGQ